MTTPFENEEDAEMVDRIISTMRKRMMRIAITHFALFLLVATGCGYIMNNYVEGTYLAKMGSVFLAGLSGVMFSGAARELGFLRRLE